MGVHVGDLIMVVLFVVLGVACYPVIADSITDANASGTDATILGLVKIVYLFVIIAGAGAFVYFKAKG